MKYKKSMVLLLSLSFLVSCSGPSKINNNDQQKNEAETPDIMLDKTEENQDNISDDKDTNDNVIDESPTWNILDELPYQTLYSFAVAENDKEVETISSVDISTSLNFSDSQVNLINAGNYPSQLAYLMEENDEGTSYTLFNFITAQRVNYFPENLNLGSLPIQTNIYGLPLAQIDVNGVSEILDLSGNYLAHYLINPMVSLVEVTNDCFVVEITDNNGFDAYFKSTVVNGIHVFSKIIYNPEVQTPETLKEPLYKYHINSNDYVSFDPSTRTYSFYALAGNLIKSIKLDDLIRNQQNIYGSPKMFATDSAIYLFFTEKETLPKESEFDVEKEVYSSYAYALNLSTYELSYTDDLNYIILEDKPKYHIIDENNYVQTGSVLKVQFYDNIGELTDFTYLIDITDSLTPTTYIRLDDMYNVKDYKVIGGKLIIKKGYDYFIVNEDRSTQLLRDVYTILYYDSNEVIYLDKQAKYKNTTVTDFLNQKQVTAYDYLSLTFTNDKHLSYNIDLANELINVNDGSIADLKYQQYVNQGLIIKEDKENKTFKVNSYGSSVFYEYDSDEINYVRAYQTSLTSTVYQINYTLSDHLYSQYILVNKEVTAL